MGSRERKRTERRRRKQRGLAQRERVVADYRVRSQQKDEAARETLEPLEEGERPPAVTVGAVVSAVLVGGGIVAFVSGLADFEPASVVPMALVSVMGLGMWKGRYWAVLGFQALLALTILQLALGLVVVDGPLQAVGNSALLLAAGTLFWFMVKAMARIQMPTRSPRT
jgi:hypothetical protein